MWKAWPFDVAAVLASVVAGLIMLDALPGNGRTVQPGALRGPTYRLQQYPTRLLTRKRRVERNRAVNLPALDPGAVAGEHTPLPPGTLRGDAHRLQQYPTLTLATSKQLAAAKRLVEQVWSGTRRWLEPAAAAAAGYGTSRVPRRHGDRTIHWMHAEHRGFYDGRTLDPRRPQNLIYANVPGEPLVLVGVMYAVRRGVHGPTPGGPVTRWHQHLVCVRGNRRGTSPRPDGSCPPGARKRLGSEMLHVWFTRDIRSAYAIHAPEPELCDAHLLPTSRCGPSVQHWHHHHHPS